MFDPPSRGYPKNWKEQSLDFKLMFVYHISMMALFMTGQWFSVRQEITLTSFLVVVLVAISLRHRRAKNWRWPSVRPLYVLGAFLCAALIAFFLFSAIPLFPPSDQRNLPWYLAGLGIGAFGILASLRVVYTSEADFLANCQRFDQYGREIESTPELPHPKDSEPDWKRMTRGIFNIIFMLVWIIGVASFFFFGKAFRDGSPTPTAIQTEPLANHGKTVFITRTEKRRVDALQLSSWIGIPLVLLGGAILHIVIGVKLFPDSSAPSEYLAERTSTKSNPPPP